MVKACVNLVESDGKKERIRLWRRVWPVLLAVACLSQIADYVGSERGRTLAQAERIAAQAERDRNAMILAERAALKSAPASAYISYTSLDPVKKTVMVGDQAAWQSTAMIHYIGETTYDDRYRCRPANANGTYGRWRLLPRFTDAFTSTAPRLLGPKKPPMIPDGYVWLDGEWVFPGPGPVVASDCVMLSNTCVEPLPGIKKCAPITSSVIHFRNEVASAETSD